MRAPRATLFLMALALWASHALAQQQPPAPGQPAPATQLPHPAPALQPAAPLAPPYSAAALYNQANSYARAGKPGLAVLNYERAALLAPNDPDISANLEFVRAAARVPTEPRSRFVQFALAADPTSAAWLGVVGIALLGASLVANKVTPRFRGVRIVGALLGAGLITLTVSNATLLWPRMHEAVVLINQTPARVSPVPMGDTAFLLREAETVTMTAQHDDYVLIRSRTGRTGWVARASLGALVP